MTTSTNPTVGDAILNHLRSSVHLETTGWAPERTTRVAHRLQQGRPREQWLTVHIPWVDVFTAFTAPGRHIFITRKLLEMCRNDEMAAFIVAHEIAHHDLEHLDVFPDWLRDATGDELSNLMAAFYRAVEKRIYGPEMECDADRHALELCLAAGYDGMACLELFDLLEKYALDQGALSMVFGPDEADDELAEDAPLSTRIKIWLFHRAHGYLPIRDRKQVLLTHLDRLALYDRDQSTDTVGSASEPS